TFNLRVNVLAEDELFRQNNIPVQIYLNPEAEANYSFPTKPDVGLSQETFVNGGDYILKRKGELTEESEVSGLERDYENYFEHGGHVNFQEKTYTVKALEFKNLVMGKKDEATYLIEAGGKPTKRKVGLSIKPDYVLFSKTQYSQNWLNNTEQGLSITEMEGEYEMPDGIIFNSQVDPSQTIDIYMLTPLDKPRIAGRVIDEFTSLGLPKVKVYLYYRATVNEGSYGTSYMLETD